MLTALLLIACSGSDESDDSTTPPDVSGGHTFVLMKDDLWITVKGDGFLAKNGAGVSQFWGTVSTLSNLFSQFIVTNSNVADPVKDDVFFGLPVNDAIMLLLPKNKVVAGEPVAFKDTSVALATGGTCPSAAVNYLAVLGPDASHNRTNMTYGQARTTAAASYALQGDLDALPDPYTSNVYSALHDFTGFTCSSGQATNSSDDKMFFTPSKMALAQTQNTNNTYTLVPTDTIPAQADIVKNGIKFRGWSEIIVNENSENENYVYPLAFTGDAAKLNGGTYDDFEGNAANATLRVVIDASAGNANLGIFDISKLVYNGTDGNFRVTASKLPDGRIVLVGVADSDNNDDTIVDNDDKDWTYIVLVEMP
jgi:hypothetical protein